MGEALATRDTTAIAVLRGSEVPMGTESFPALLARRWRNRFLYDDGAAEFVLHSISVLRAGSRLGEIAIDVDRQVSPTLYARRQQQAVELLRIGQHDQSLLTGIAEIATSHIAQEQEYLAKQRLEDDSFAAADFLL